MLRLLATAALVGTSAAFAAFAPAAPRGARSTARRAAAVSYPENDALIEVGAAVPAVTLQKNKDEQEDVTLAALLADSGGGSTVLVGVPAAFSPTCSDTHIPGFVETAAEMAALGVARTVVMSVNDRFVMKAWGKALGLPEIAFSADVYTRPELLADGAGNVASALGLLTDKGAMGGRCKR